MNPEHRALFAILKQQLRPDRPDKLEGWTDAERGYELAEMVLKTRPEIIVEIGVFGGRSLVAMALALQQLGRGRIYGIDPWKKQATTETEQGANRKWWNSVDLNLIHNKAMKAIWELNLDPYVVIIRSESQFVANLFPTIDYLNVDGNHSEVASVADITNYLPRVRSGGIVFMDDINWPTTAKAVAMIKESCREIKDLGSAKFFEKL